MRNIVGYSDQFRSIWLNSSAQNTTVRQLYGPANIYGIMNDHDYLERRPEDMFLEHIGVTAMTENRPRSIQEKTCGQSSNKLWKEEQLLRLQVSNFGRVCMATDKTNFLKLVASFTLFNNILFSDPIKHGRKYEAIARSAYVELTGNVVVESGIVVCADSPYLGCSLDGLIGEDGIIEIKYPFTSCDKDITPETVPYQMLDDHTGKLSLQVQHEYHHQIMGTMMCDLVVWTFKGLVIVHLELDQNFIASIHHQLNNFFNNHFRPALFKKQLYKDSHMFLFVQELY